jgi:anti-sigma B factor antagonist
MQLTVKEKNDILIVNLEGNLDTNTSPDVETELNKLIEPDGVKLIINLSLTNYVSSAGLRIFLATAKKLTAKQGVFKLCAPNDVVKEVLDISGFSSILDVKTTEEEAIAEM